MNLVIYTNILTPYRKYFYDLLYEECKKNGDQFHVLVMSETEPGRRWKYYDFSACYTHLLKGFSLVRGGVCIHINADLKKTLRQLKPDLLICGGAYLHPGVWLACWQKKRLQYKCFFWSESHLNESRKCQTWKLKVREKIRQRLYHNFDGFWVAGKLAERFVHKYVAGAKHICFVPNLINERRYLALADDKNNAFRRRSHIAPGRIIMFCPARLIPVKGIVPFLKLLKKCHNKNSVTVLIAGEGEEKDNIVKEAVSLDVRLLGYQSEEAVADLYAVSDIFVLPSLSDPNPLSCIEAAWSGLPLLVTKHVGNYPELVREGLNGYVISYDRQEEAVKKIETLISSSAEWYQKAGRISVQIARKRYKSEEASRRIIEDSRIYLGGKPEW